MCLTFSFVKSSQRVSPCLRAKTRPRISLGDKFVTGLHLFLSCACNGEASIPIICASLISNSTGVVAMSSRELHVETEQAEPPWKSVGATFELFFSVRSMGSHPVVVVVRKIGQTVLRPGIAQGISMWGIKQRRSARCRRKWIFRKWVEQRRLWLMAHGGWRCFCGRSKLKRCEALKPWALSHAHEKHVCVRK